MQVRYYYKDGTIFEGENCRAPHHRNFSKVLHRKNGPAICWADGDTYWYQNGKRHREDGPAREWYEAKEWWLEDKQYTQEEFEKAH